MPVRISSPRFVGRTDELEQLVVTYKSAATEERAATVLVGGEAGVGKSRLIAELAARVDEAGGLVLVGSCLDLSRVALPFGPIVQAIRAMHAALDPDVLDEIVGSAGEALDRLVPEMASSDGAEHVAPAALFEHLRGVLERLSDHVPTLLVLEDVHWADDSTRDLLVYLARNLRDARVTLVATYRTDDLHRRHPLRAVVSELDRSGAAQRIELGRFDREELSEMVGSISGRDPGPDLVDAVYERSDGNAFFAEELMAAGGPRDELPESLRDIVLRRVDGLSNDARRLLGIVSVIGRRADHRLVAAVAGADETVSTGGLREAVEHQVLIVDRQGTSYEFRHALTAEAVYEDLMPGERVAVHARLAGLLADHPDWCEGGSAGAAAELAGHWCAAHDARRAVPALLAAAAEAERMCATRDALAHVEHALELWPQVPDAMDACGMRHLDVLRRASELADLSGLLDRSLEFIQIAADEVESADDPIAFGLVHERWGSLLQRAGGSVDEALAHVDRALALIPDTRPAERARVLATSGGMHMLSGRDRDGVEICAAAIALAQAAGDPVTESHARNSLGVMLAGLGEVDRGLDELRRARQQAVEARAWDAVARAYQNEASILAAAARHQDALDLVTEAIEVARSHGNDNRINTGLLPTLCEQLWPLGRWAQMEPHLRHMEAARPQGIDEWCLGKKLVEWNAGRGAYLEAEAALEHLRNLLGPNLDVKWHFELSHLGVELAMWRGDFATAADVAITAISVATTDTVDPESDSATMLVLNGMAAASWRRDVEQARTIASRFEEWLPGGLWSTLPGDIAIVERQVAAELDLVEGRGDADEWAGIADEWLSICMVPRATVARWREAELRLAGSDRAGAAAAARAAYELATQIGWQWARDGIADLARRGRLDIGLESDAGSDDGIPTEARALGLTKRELEVLVLVAAGRTNRQIAETLYISAKTASAHVSNLLLKLSVTNRGEAAAAAHRLGLA